MKSYDLDVFFNSTVTKKKHKSQSFLFSSSFFYFREDLIEIVF